MRQITALLAAVTLAACSGPVDPPAPTITGTYAIQSFLGKPMPYTLVEIDQEDYHEFARITSVVLVISENGRWTETQTRLSTVNGTTTPMILSDSGSWSLSGESVTLTSETVGGWGIRPGSWTPGTLTLTGAFPEWIFVYRK